MRIYAVADIHGRPHRVARIQENVARFTPDALVVAGDIARFGRAETALAALGEMTLPVLAIRGNWDRARMEVLMAHHPRIVSLHLKKVCVNGVDFVGVDGTLALPFRCRVCMKEKHVLEKIDPLLDRHSVLVAHPPPRGTLDEVFGRFHAGSTGLFELISRRQPALFICGHIHERPGTAFIGETLVVNCNMGRRGAGALIEFEKGRNPEARMLEEE